MFECNSQTGIRKVMVMNQWGHRIDAGNSSFPCHCKMSAIPKAFCEVSMVFWGRVPATNDFGSFWASEITTTINCGTIYCQRVLNYSKKIIDDGARITGNGAHTPVAPVLAVWPITAYYHYSTLQHIIGNLVESDISSQSYRITDNHKNLLGITCVLGVRRQIYVYWLLYTLSGYTVHICAVNSAVGCFMLNCDNQRS